MKKIAIALTAVAMATCAQAYNVYWGLGSDSYEDWSGKAISDTSSGVTAYLYALTDAASALTFKDNALVGIGDNAKLVDSSVYGKDDIPGWGNAMGSPIDSSVSTLGNEFQQFQIILTDGNIDALVEGDHVYVLTAQEVQGSDLTIGGTNWEYMYIDTDTSLNQGGWNTVAAPEPTSGLLLLIGVAGLALKRRRA